MKTASLPLGNGVNLDVNESTVQDGGAISFINAYVDRGGAVRTVPGCAEYLDTGAGNSSVWMWYSTTHLIMVIVSAGRVWIQSAKDGALTEILGTALTAGSRPTFAEDASSIFFAADSKIHMLTGGVLTILGALSPNSVSSLAFIGGYLMSDGDRPTDPVAGDTHYSDDKANGYAAWELYNNESRPDGLQCLVVAYEQIYNIGRTSLEVAYIDGTVPFSVNKNAAQHFGTMAPQSVAFDGENIYYLSEVAGSRKIIQLAGGGTPQIISFPVDVPLEDFERVDDAQGFIMAFRGRNGYAVTFPTANATVDEQYWTAITLFYQLQSKEWIILAQWDADTASYGPYRGVSFAYVEAWGGLKLIGGRDGKIYQLQDTTGQDYTEAPVFLHRWRDNGSKVWGNAREISLGLAGQYDLEPESRQCGVYRKRQHQFIFTDLTDAGAIFRAAIKTGHISHKSPNKKAAAVYRYDVQCGKPEFVLNGVVESYEILRS